MAAPVATVNSDPPGDRDGMEKGAPARKYGGGREMAGVSQIGGESEIAALDRSQICR